MFGLKVPANVSQTDRLDSSSGSTLTHGLWSWWPGWVQCESSDVTSCVFSAVFSSGPTEHKFWGSHRNSATGSVHVSDQTFKLTSLQGYQNRSQSLNTGTSVRSTVRSAVSPWRHSLPVSCSALQLRLSVSEKHLEHLQTENTGNCSLSVKLLQVSQEMSDCLFLMCFVFSVQSVKLSLMESKLTDGLNRTTGQDWVTIPLITDVSVNLIGLYWRF